jgi:hypothetical protein
VCSSDLAVASLPIAEAVEALREREHRSLDRASGKARARHGPSNPDVTEASSGRFAGLEAGGAPALSASTGKDTWPHGLGRRRRCRGRPIPGDHPTTTRVSAPSSSGEIARVVRERVRKDPKERERERSPWRGGATGRERFRKRSRSRRSDAASRKGRGATSRGLEASRCASWVGYTAEALVRLS